MEFFILLLLGAMGIAYTSLVGIFFWAIYAAIREALRPWPDAHLAIVVLAMVYLLVGGTLCYLFCIKGRR
jgi:hypothetical protein